MREHSTYESRMVYHRTYRYIGYIYLLHSLFILHIKFPIRLWETYLYAIPIEDAIFFSIFSRGSQVKANKYSQS